MTAAIRPFTATASCLFSAAPGPLIDPIICAGWISEPAGSERRSAATLPSIARPGGAGHDVQAGRLPAEQLRVRPEAEEAAAEERDLPAHGSWRCRASACTSAVSPAPSGEEVHLGRVAAARKKERPSTCHGS